MIDDNTPMHDRPLAQSGLILPISRAIRLDHDRRDRRQ
jgi:hypothetical protein